LNLAQLGEGEPVLVGVSFEELGATVLIAVAKLEATMQAWVAGRQPSRELERGAGA